MSALSALSITRQDVYADPSNPNDTLTDYLIVSDVELSGKAEAISIGDLKTETGYSKCERSWKYFKGEGEITPRDAAAVAEYDAN